MKLKKTHIIDNLTRDDVKYYETRLGTPGQKRHKTKKVDQSDFVIPQISQYDEVINNNYNVAQLKLITKRYGLKVSGNKNELNKRVYLYLLYNHHATQIQRNVRRKIVYSYVTASGPAFNNRTICVNDADFLSLEKLENIDYVNFFSEQDGDKVYGFDAVSLFNFIRRDRVDGKRCTKNPFTNCSFNSELVYGRLKRFISLSNVLDTGLNVNSIEEENSSNEVTDSFGYRVRELFHYIDSLGNYTSNEWFIRLGRRSLVKFIRELLDIWNYRADLSEQAKINICNPTGTPFICRQTRIPLFTIADTVPTDSIRVRAFAIMENMVRFSINRENSAIGCYYLLGALTLVCDDAAEAMPWLYQCMYHG